LDVYFTKERADTATYKKITGMFQIILGLLFLSMSTQVSSNQ